MSKTRVEELMGAISGRGTSLEGKAVEWRERKRKDRKFKKVKEDETKKDDDVLVLEASKEDKEYLN
jgi:hypothetical protein